MLLRDQDSEQTKLSHLRTELERNLPLNGVQLVRHWQNLCHGEVAHRLLQHLAFRGEVHAQVVHALPRHLSFIWRHDLSPHAGPNWCAETRQLLLLVGPFPSCASARYRLPGGSGSPVLLERLCSLAEYHQGSCALKTAPHRQRAATRRLRSSPQPTAQTR